MDLPPTTDPESLSPGELSDVPRADADSEGYTQTSNKLGDASTDAGLARAFLAKDIADAVGTGMERPFSFFLALRTIFLLYAAVAMIVGLGYEIWCVLTR